MFSQSCQQLTAFISYVDICIPELNRSFQFYKSKEQFKAFKKFLNLQNPIYYW